jgi:transcriptional regulator with XRE-family HTH domain
LGKVEEALGARIRHYREKRGLTQVGLAELLRVHEQTVIRYESGDINIPTRRLREIAKVLDIDVGALMVGEEMERRFRDASERKAVNSVREAPPMTLGWYVNIPLAARQRILEYSQRLQKAGMSEMDIAHFERIILDFTYSQYHIASEPPRTEEEWIGEVDDAWAAVEDYLRRKGVKL